MNIEPNEYDKILGLFVSDDELRPKMMQPCKRGDFVFATDAYAIIKIPVGIVNLDYSQEHEFYNIEPFFEVNRNVAQQIDFEPIQKWFDTVPMLPVYEDCDNCDGEGTVYCKHCKNESECPDCNGTGHGKEIGKKPSHFDRYELDGVGFSYKNLYRLFLLSKNENTPATWKFRDSTKINVFEVKNIEVALMPLVG
jgi:hypothetical protein